MKALVIGSGGREHALVHALSSSPSVTEIHAVPGSSGIGQLAICHNLSWQQGEQIAELCLKQKIDFVIIGPEDPLVDGLADLLRSHGIAVVGPSQTGARLEGSKIFAKEFMCEAKIPTADYEIVTDVEVTLRAALRFQPPYILKADGLAAGKGVFICKTIDELKAAAIDIFEKKTLGSAGSRALLEQNLPGWEMSYLVLTNGESYQVLPLAQDNKRLMDNDLGPNTGGMGTIAPMNIDQSLQDEINTKIVEPTISLLKEKSILFRGVIFFGLMITKNGPQLLEYNCRFGDPETQVILPLIEEDLGQVLLALAQGELIKIHTKKNLCATCVVMAAPGYPQSPQKGLPIEGDLNSGSSTQYFIHAGTAQTSSGAWQTNGGRVLCAVGLGKTAQDSRSAAYAQAKEVYWAGMQMRSDIGKVIKQG